MAQDSPLKLLRQILAELYPTETDARRIAADAGLVLQNISFSNKAIDTWNSILTYACNNEQVEDVIQMALDQFPRNTDLSTAEKQWLAYKQQPAVLTEQAGIDDTSPPIQPRSVPQIFISYSHDDKEYTHRLTESLEKEGFQVWIDDRIDYGSEWPKEIQKHLEQCSVFVLIMTPKSYNSRWVQNELAWALYNNKSIFPLLLEGDQWLSVASIQHIDVRSAELPRKDFYENVRKRLPTVKKAELSLTDGEPDRKMKPLTSKKGEPEEPEVRTKVEQADVEKVEQKRRVKRKPKKVPSQKQQKRTGQAKKQSSPKMTRARVIQLRSEPLTVSKKNAQQVFKLDESGQPLEYIKNDFEVKGETVIDHTTGLMWQQSGSDKYMRYKKAQAYIEELNRKRFAGYTDWRLPTVEELMSLLEPKKRSNGLYINPIFDERLIWFWSIDKCSSGSAWFVDFTSGLVDWKYLLILSYYVRAVHAWQ